MIKRLQSSVRRHLTVNNSGPYEDILRDVTARDDIWLTSQGDFIDWWVKREHAPLSIVVADGECHLSTPLDHAVIQKYPDQFVEGPNFPCPEATYSGVVWITIHSEIPQKAWLVEFLKREGILNYRIANEGDFIIRPDDVADLLANIEAKQQQRRRPRPFEEDVAALRQIVIDKLARHRLPLFRIWYHPRVNGWVPKAVFSPRYDVDRAITNLGQIRALEKRYGVASTFYIRSFCPFYVDQTVSELASQEWCSEIALHGEFVTNAKKYGSELNAAQAEKAHLEQIAQRAVTGVCMHGGELTRNKSHYTARIVQDAEFLYDTTMTFAYYFPFREIVDGQPSRSYTLCHAVSDIAIPADHHYGRTLYAQAVAKMDEIYRQNGVFILMQHPVYFDFLHYSVQPKNWGSLIKFSVDTLKSGLSK
ncbi:MAG: hypothetical protein KDJ97_08845 [Anaerolineae bacterium]|nr:hypothetical protein [Anaerolineae bacterium]